MWVKRSVVSGELVYVRPGFLEGEDRLHAWRESVELQAARPHVGTDHPTLRSGELAARQ